MCGKMTKRAPWAALWCSCWGFIYWLVPATMIGSSAVTAAMAVVPLSFSPSQLNCLHKCVRDFKASEFLL